MFTENFIMTQMADVEQRTKMANSLKKVLEETFRDSLIFPKGEVPFHSFAIKGFYSEEMIVSENVLFDEMSVAYVTTRRLETGLCLKEEFTYPEEIGYASDIMVQMVHEDQGDCKKHIQNVLEYAAEATLKWEESIFDQSMDEFKKT